MMLAKQQQMQRDPSNGDHQQRSGSPGSAENAPSPSKRARLDAAGNFNPQQMTNGRQPMPQQVGDSGPNSTIQAAHMQLANGIEPNNLTAQQFQNMPGGPNSQQARSLAGYQAGLAQQQAGQMPNKGMANAGPANQGSPMMNQGQDGGAIAGYYNAGEMAGGMRGVAPGQQAAGGGNHALQDYQMQLMLLEQQNKKRLMMARQEQDSMAIPGQREGVAPGMNPNGQPFQGTSPQGTRSVNSPNPTDQMKRGTPHMNPAGIPSPMPEGQSRGSPGGMNFAMPGGQMDPNLNQQYFMKNGGMDPNMVGAMPNGMRPPSSHPAGGFNQMAPNQMNMAQQGQRQNGNWQAGPNGQMMPGPGQAGPQQVMGQGTPQQRPMAPPAAPGPVPNGRTQPPSPQQNPAPPTPQQTNKANPKKKNDAKETKAKVNIFSSTAVFIKVLTLITADYKEGSCFNYWCNTIRRISSRTGHSYSRDADYTDPSQQLQERSKWRCSTSNEWPTCSPNEWRPTTTRLSTGRVVHGPCRKSRCIQGYLLY
jgi:hypothetical protein